jgi:beta-xylosidase
MSSSNTRPATTTMQSAGDGFPWVPDDGAGGYVNPIVFADYSDPDVVRVGDDFWMTASSFNCTPGLPLLRSRDLVNWTLVGHALANVPGSRYDAVLPGCGVWAPAIRFHAGRLWIFFPTPDEGIYQTTAVDPLGPWTEPVLVQAGRGLIDPCPLWDDDGRAWLVHAYAGSRTGGIKNKLDVREMAPDGTRLIGSPTTIFNDPKHHPTAEGPKFYKRGDTYWVFAPAGGVGTGWQLAMRSKSVLGPYEARIVMAQGHTDVNGPHQGALVDTPAGASWFVHFQERLPYGRIIHLQPVTWGADGWPLIGEPSDQPGVGQPVLRHRKPAVPPQPIATPATTDLFTGATLGPQWQWHANHRDDWASLADRPGWLRLRAMPVHPTDLSLTPHLLLQKFPAPVFGVQTKVQLAEVGTGGGMAVVGRRSAALYLRRRPTHDAAEVVLRIGDAEAFSAPVQGDAIFLRADVHAGGRCTFAYQADEDWVDLSDAFQAIEGMWIGAKIGLFASAEDGAPAGGGHADFQPFRFSAGTDSP